MHYTKNSSTGALEKHDEIVKFRLAANGRIKQWATNKMADVESGVFVKGFAEDTSKYGYEWMRNTFVKSTGQTILEMGTQADSFKITISRDRTQASFVYSDFGSGAGNHSFELACKVTE